MSDPAPSDKFLFFQPSRVFERFILPGYFIIIFGWILYSYRGLTYALYLSPRARWLAVAGWILASSALTLSLVEYSLGVRRKPRAAAETALKKYSGEKYGTTV